MMRKKDSDPSVEKQEKVSKKKEYQKPEMKKNKILKKTLFAMQ